MMLMAEMLLEVSEKQQHPAIGIDPHCPCARKSNIHRI